MTASAPFDARNEERVKPRPRRDRISIVVSATYVARINIIISKSKAGPRPVSALFSLSLSFVSLSLLLSRYPRERVQQPYTLSSLSPFPSSPLFVAGVFVDTRRSNFVRHRRPRLHSFLPSFIFYFALFPSALSLPLSVSPARDFLAPPFFLRRAFPPSLSRFSCFVLVQPARFSLKACCLAR